MKKSTLVQILATSFLSLAVLAGCSSASKEASEEQPGAPVEAAANNDAFNALVNSDPSTTGAVVDQTSPVLVADAGVQHAVADSTPHSPVNLGASSAGRAH